jgi:hypothetical protein
VGVFEKINMSGLQSSHGGLHQEAGLEPDDFTQHHPAPSALTLHNQHADHAAVADLIATTLDDGEGDLDADMDAREYEAAFIGTNDEPAPKRLKTDALQQAFAKKVINSQWDANFARLKEYKAVFGVSERLQSRLT